MSQFQIEKRFGYIAVDKGFITEEELAEAMVLQINEDLCGMDHRLVGQILISLGYMTKNHVDQVIIAMHFPLVFCGNYIGMPPSRLSDTKSNKAIRQDNRILKKPWS